jgi:hypothetical protein
MEVPFSKLFAYASDGASVVASKLHASTVTYWPIDGTPAVRGGAAEMR